VPIELPAASVPPEATVTDEPAPEPTVPEPPSVPPCSTATLAAARRIAHLQRPARNRGGAGEARAVAGQGGGAGEMTQFMRAGTGAQQPRIERDLAIVVEVQRVRPSPNAIAAASSVPAAAAVSPAAAPMLSVPLLLEKVPK